MRIGFCQFAPSFGKHSENVEQICELLAPHAFDVLVLPELALSGYSFRSREEAFDLAEEPDTSPHLLRLAKLAKQKEALLIVGIAERAGTKLYNSAVALSPSGILNVTRKRHLPRYELQVFDRGAEALVFQWQGHGIGTAVCFDSWFPEAVRLLRQQGAKLLCHPANYGCPWTQQVMQVRALENMMFCVSANRIGQEDRAGYTAYFRGESLILDEYGQPLAQAEAVPHVAICKVDLSRACQRPNLLCPELPEDAADDLSLYEPTRLADSYPMGFAQRQSKLPLPIDHQ